MTKSGKSLNQVEESSIVPPINDSAGLRPIDKIKNQDKDSKSKYLDGPYLGVVAHIEVIKAGEDPMSLFGEFIESEWKTFKLRVLVPEMNSSCGELTLPTDDNWKSSDMRKIKMLPQFVGQYSVGDHRSAEPQIGDIVAVNYYDKNKPRKGGTYLGIAYSRHGTHNLAKLKAEEVFRTKILTDIATTLLEADERGIVTNDEIKSCYKQLQISNVGFLPPGNRFLINPDPNEAGMAENMLYGQICMLGFGNSLSPFFNKEIAQVYDRNTEGLRRNKSPIKKIKLSGKVFENESASTVFVHEKAELAFRMVFKQIEHMQGFDESVNKFRIYRTKTHRNPHCARNGDYEEKLVRDENGRLGCKETKTNGKVLPYPQGVSRHCFGLAIDMNAKENPQVSSNKSTGDEQFEAWQNSTNKYRIPDKVIQIFKYYGFRWGGNFGRKDLHHFDFIGDPNLIVVSYYRGFEYAIRNGLTTENLKIGNDQDFWNQGLNVYLQGKKWDWTGGI